MSTSNGRGRSMRLWETWLLHAGTLLVGGTGVVYAVFRYFTTPTDPWAVVNHPWQPHVQHLHVLLAPLLVFGAGAVWRRHVMAKYGSGTAERRSSGLSLMLTLVPMVVSGYLIQVAVSDGWRKAWVVTHLVASVAWIGAYAGHQVAALRRRPAVEVPGALELHADEVEGTFPRRGPELGRAGAWPRLRHRQRGRGGRRDPQAAGDPPPSPPDGPRETR